MGQAVKTIRRAFTTLTTTLATNTTLGTATEHDFADITVQMPESSRTIRCAMLRVRLRGQEPTTARRFDGIRIGVQIDAVAFDDGTDLTGTGITNTGDPWSIYADRDVTSYFVTNYTGTSHAVGCRVRVEEDVADIVGNITCELIITYEYDDTSSTQIKTVLIPLEGITGFLTTTANTDLRGSTGAAQIPNLDTFLPEASKTYRQIYFIIEASDGGAATTDFNVNYSIDAGATATRATLEQGLNGSVRFFDIWNEEGFTKNATHDFEAWSSLASRFERLHVTMVVTYEFDASSTTTVMNSILLAIPTESHNLQGTTAADRDVYESVLNIAEPGTITLVQSAVRMHFMATGSGTYNILVSGHGVAGGTQSNTTAAYTITAFVGSGNQSFQHRIDVGHGGTAITLARGKNILRCKSWASGANTIFSVSGFYIINYTSDKSSVGIGAHNQTTEWQIADLYSGSIAGSTLRSIATTNQRTPIIPQSNYYLNGSSFILEQNTSASAYQALLAEILSGEGKEDGWASIDVSTGVLDGEFGHSTYLFTGRDNWLHYPTDPAFDAGHMNVETARVYRLVTGTSQTSLIRRITTHSITFTISGTISGSSGGTVNIGLFNATTFEMYKSTSRVGNGTYSFEWFDDTQDLIVMAWETDTLKGASKQGTPATDFDINLVSGGGAATVGGRILIV